MPVPRCPKMRARVEKVDMLRWTLSFNAMKLNPHCRLLLGPRKYISLGSWNLTVKWISILVKLEVMS